MEERSRGTSPTAHYMEGDHNDSPTVEASEQVDIIVEEPNHPDKVEQVDIPIVKEPNEFEDQINYFKTAAKGKHPFDESKPDWVPTTPLRCRRNTVLHVAVGRNSWKGGNPWNLFCYKRKLKKHGDYVKYLVKHMTSEELEIRNADGDTAFCVAATRGNLEIAKILLQKNPGLASISGHAGMLPFELAASRGHRQMAEFIYYSTEKDVQDLPRERKVQLLTLAITERFYDVARSLMESNPGLSTTPNRERLTAYQHSGRLSPPFFHFVEDNGWHSFQRAMMDPSTGEEKHPHQLSALFEAAKSGNREFCSYFLRHNPDLILEVDSMGRSILHIAVKYRRENVFLEILDSFYLFNDHLCKDQLIQVVDNVGNNILHLAAIMPPEETFESSRPNIRMHSEEHWFKEVGKRVPSAFKTMKNKDGLTPKELFRKEHKELSRKGEYAAKGIAKSGMIVATLIATIVFAAALTVPSKDTPSKPHSQSPIFQKETWFVIFFLSDAVALFSSSSSIIFYLSILSSSFPEDEVISSLQRRLMFGLMTLFFSITSMVVAFIAASFLIFQQLSTWIAYVVASLGCIPVILFLGLHIKLWRDLLPSSYKFRVYMLKAITLCLGSVGFLTCVLLCTILSLLAAIPYLLIAISYRIIRSRWPSWWISA